MTAPRITFRGVPIGDLIDNPINVRDEIKPSEIEDLAASIRANGILQPLIVNQVGGRLVVTDGHRRLAAARLALVPVIPCLITDGQDERTVLTTMLATAMHKELTPIEQARAFGQLRDEGLLVPEIARSTGYSQHLVKNRLLLLELPREAQAMVEADELTIGQATDLAKQVKATRAGTTATKVTRSSWLTHTHRLARFVSLRCDHQESRRLVGSVGCGQCWEAVIAQDATGQTLELIPTGADDAAVQRVLSGERLDISRNDRLEAVRRLVDQGLSDAQIADRVNATERTVLRDRQDLQLASPIGRSGHNQPTKEIA